MAKQKTYSQRGFVILNAQGEPWTPEYFESVASGLSYIRAYESSYPCAIDLSKHTVVPAKFTIKPLTTKGTKNDD